MLRDEVLAICWIAMVASWLAGCDLDMEPAEVAHGTAGPAAVLLEIDGRVPQFPDPSGFLSGFAKSQHELEKLFERAASDIQVQEVVVHFGAPEVSWARAGEIGDAIARLSATGKPVTCHLESADNLTYWAAAKGCPRLLLAPAGSIDLVGLSLDAVYLREMLDSLGITAEMMHVGRYKDAAETLTRNEMSPEARQAAESILDELDKHFVAGVAKGRGVPEAEAKRLVTGGPYGPDAALAAGLVDGVTTLGRYLDTIRDERGCRIEDEYGKEPPKPFSFGDLLELLGGGAQPSVEPRPPRIALIPAVGPVMGGGSDEDFLGGMETVRDIELVMDLAAAARDDSIRAVVIRVDSPGGSALASDNIWDAVRAVAARKPVVASLGDVAASGGYYIASAATEVFASPTTLTGSIGVVGGKIVLTDAMGKIGVHTETLQRGERAAIASPFRLFSEEERGVVNDLMREAYDLFVDRVVEGRGIDRAAVLSAAEGRVWTGSQAAQMGLVTKAGTLHDAIERARELASLPGGPVQIHPEPKNLMEIIGEALGDPGMGAVSVARRFPAGARALALASLLGSNRVVAFEPTVIEIR